MSFALIASVMTAIALAFLLVPFLLRRKPSIEWAKHKTVVAVAIAVPIAAIVLYTQIGNPDAIGVVGSGHPSIPGGAQSASVGSIEEMVERLGARLAAEPGDAEGWALLARSYQYLERYAEADEAYRRVVALRGEDPQLVAEWNKVRELAGISGPAGAAAPQAGGDPAAAASWLALARSHQTARRYREASEAFAKALEAGPPEPASVWADYADALAMIDGGRVDGEPARAVARALQIDPDHRKALWLAGTAAFQTADYSTALGHWRRLRQLTPPESSDTPVIAANIADTELKLAQQSAAAPPPAASAAAAEATSPAPAATTSAVVTGRVSIAPALRSRAANTDTVFVFARAAAGPPMPVAVVRRLVLELPLEFELDDNLAMMPTLKLSQFEEVLVGARVSKSGSATPQAGDLVAAGVRVRVGSGDRVELVIDSVEP